MIGDSTIGLIVGSSPRILHGNMLTVAIVGAGDIGGACAHALAARDDVDRIVLIDRAAGAAAGKALDIKQSGAIAGLHVDLVGTDDWSRVAGCAVCVVADRFGPGSPEWRGEDGLVLVGQLARACGEAPIVLAGATQEALAAAAVREARVQRRRVIATAPEAFGAAVAAMVAMEAECSATEVSLAVLGVPPDALVVPWSGASIGGYPLEAVLPPARVARIEARVARLWPPGPFALGAAAARVVSGLLASDRRTYNVLIVLDGEFGARNRLGTVPAVLGPLGIASTRVPPLNSRERVRVDIALGA